MEENLIIVALKRSGQHGVINWLGKQSNENVIHYNHCIKGWDNKEFKPMREDFTVFYDNINDGVENYFFDSKIDSVKSRQLNEKLKKRKFENVKHNIYNIEDLSLKEFIDNDMVNFKQIKENGKLIIILRDPFNFIASCLQRKLNPPDGGAVDVAVNIKERLKIWIEHAKEFCGETNSIPIEKVFISYNDWFKDSEYRKKICNELGLDFTDKGLNKVINYGSGSSFDREKFDGKAQEMNVLNRWEKFKDNDEFNNLLIPEIIRLSEKIFNFNPLKK